MVIIASIFLRPIVVRQNCCILKSDLVYFIFFSAQTTTTTIPPSSNLKISIFSSSIDFLCDILILASQPNLICETAEWNSTIRVIAGTTSSSTAANRLSYPMDVFIDGYDYLYVTDYNNNRIQRFPPGLYISLFC